MATKKSARAAAVAPKVEPDLPNDLPSAAEMIEAIVEPAAEMQETVKHALEKSVEETRAAIGKAKASAEEAANAFEVSFTAAKDGVLAFNAKALAAARANAEANFDLVKASFAVKSVGDLVSLHSDFARKQSEAVVVQLKDLAETAKKTVVETIEPFKEQVTKTFKIAV